MFGGFISIVLLFGKKINRSWFERKNSNVFGLKIVSFLLELHKYQSNYDDSLIIKIYLFQFFNFYSSLFYVAFFKGRYEYRKICLHPQINH